MIFSSESHFLMATVISIPANQVVKNKLVHQKVSEMKKGCSGCLEVGKRMRCTITHIVSIPASAIGELYQGKHYDCGRFCEPIAAGS